MSILVASTLHTHFLSRKHEKKKKKRLRPRGACRSPSILSVGCSQGWPLFSWPWAAELFLLFYFPRPALLLVVWRERERECVCVCVPLPLSVCVPDSYFLLPSYSCSWCHDSSLRADRKKSVDPSLFLSIQIAKVHLGTHHVPAPTLCHHILMGHSHYKPHFAADETLSLREAKTHAQVHTAVKCGS